MKKILFIIFLFFLTINSIYSWTNSSTTSGIYIEYQYSNQTTEPTYLDYNKPGFNFTSTSINSGFNINFEMVQNLTPQPLHIIYNPFAQTNINSGMEMFYELVFIPLDPVSYSNPTPKNNIKTSNNNITINISYNENEINNCILNLSNQIILMQDFGTYCEYNFIQSNITNPLILTFQVKYNISGSLTNLEKRTIYLYSNSPETKSVPAFSIISLLLFISIIFFN